MSRVSNLRLIHFLVEPETEVRCTIKAIKTIKTGNMGRSTLSSITIVAIIQNHILAADFG